jgi:hypothetical protein
LELLELQATQVSRGLQVLLELMVVMEPQVPQEGREAQGLLATLEQRVLLELLVLLELREAQGLLAILG